MLRIALNKYFRKHNILFYIMLLLFVIAIFKISDITILFFASYVIACSLEPLVKFFEKKYKHNVACLLSLLSILAIILAIFLPLVALASQEIKNFAISFPNYMDNLKDFLLSIPFVSNNIISQSNISNIISSATGVTSQIINETLVISKNLSSFFVYLFLSIIITYYFMIDKKEVQEGILKLFPSNIKLKAENILNTISKKIGGYVIAQLITMFSVGLIMSIGLAILKVEYALLLGFITAIFDIIPVVGPLLALIITLLVTYKSGYLIMLFVCIIFAIAQLAENNFIRPYIFGKFLDIHPLIIYLFLFIAAKYLGILGVIFSPAIAATSVVLIQELYIKNIK